MAADTTYQGTGLQRRQDGTTAIPTGGSLDIESGGALKLAGTTLSASAAELNLSDNQVAGVTYTIGSETANDIVVSLQLTDAAGNDMATVSALNFYFSSDAAGKDVDASGPDSLAIATDGSVYMSGGDSVIAGMFVTEADGDVAFTITHAGADSFYFCTMLPNGSVDVSAVITFDATT